MNLTIEGVTLSYPHLFRAKTINDTGAPKFSAAFLIPESNPQLRELFDLANQVINTKYPNGELPHNFKGLPCYNAADHPKYSKLEAYKGMWLLNSSKAESQGAPIIVDQQRNKVIDQSLIYPGLVVNVAVSIYTYDHPTSKGVTTGLEAIQIVRDGDRLDNRPSADELFQPIPVVGGASGGAGGPAGGPAGGGDPLG
jgi:hypothetical protein